MKTLNIDLLNGKSIAAEIKGSVNGGYVLAFGLTFRVAFKKDSNVIVTSKGNKEIAKFFGMSQLNGVEVMLRISEKTSVELKNYIKEADAELKVRLENERNAAIAAAPKKTILCFFRVIENAEVIEIAYVNNSWVLSQVLFVMPASFRMPEASFLSFSSENYLGSDAEYEVSESDIETLKNIRSGKIETENEKKQAVKEEKEAIRKERIETEVKRIETLKQQAKETGKKVIVSRTSYEYEKNGYNTIETITKFVLPNGAFETSTIDCH